LKNQGHQVFVRGQSNPATFHPHQPTDADSQCSRHVSGRF